jgi:hypothetical protein
MAGYCAKCGSQLSADTRFCTSCGAPTDLAASPATPAGQVPAAAPKSAGALKVILIVVGVFVGLGVLSVAAAMFGLWRISKTVNIDRSGAGVTITTPKGKITAGQTSVHVTEAEVGAPIYPGATSAEGGIKFGGEGGSMATYPFKTSDSVQQVAAFYRDKFGPKVSVVESPEGALITSTSKNENETIMVTIGRDQSDGHTSIVISHAISTKNK